MKQPEWYSNVQPVRRVAGPAEEWFCRCRDHRGNVKLRPRTWRNCPDCGERRP